MKYLTIAVSLLAAPIMMAADHQVQVTWEELSPWIAGKEISMVLPDSTHISGFALAVRPEVLRVDIRKTSDTHAHAKGETEIARDSVSLIELRQHGATSAGRLARAAGGFLIGPLVGGLVGALASGGDGTAAQAGAYAGMAAGTIIGWKIGDPKKTNIRVLPAPRQTSEEAR